MTSLNPDCTLCDLHKSAQVVCVKGSGPSPCDIMIIGEAPSFRRSDQAAVPFSGQSGKLLFQLLQEVGISSDQCYITNVVHCHPPENQTPSTSEVKACMEYLLEEIDQVKPQYVLLLGATALKGVLRKSKITQIHGTFIEKDGITYLPTFHPAAVLRDPSKVDLLRSDLRKFAQLTLGYDPTLAHELSYVVITSLDRFNACLDDLRQSPAVAFDLETSGLDMFEDGAKIHCLGLATLHGTQWILPVSPFDGGEPVFDYATQKMMVESLAEVLSSRKVIGHNAKFDNKWLRVIFGVRFPLTFDTMIAAHLLDENISAGLKYQAKIHFNAPDYDLSTSEKKGNVDPSRLYKYCAYDVYFTALLYQKFKGDLNNDPALKKVFMWLMMPAAEVFEEIELNGVFVNQEKMSQLEKELRARLDDLKAKLESLAPGINWNSPKQVGDILYNQWGIAPLEYTKKGLPSTAEPVLQRLKNLHSGVNTLLEYREVHKQLSGFIEGWHRFIHGDRMHPNFRLTGTVTGRLSCSEPNLQQVPRDPKIRSLITAPPGWTFVEADYSQVELRVAAMLSGDPMMIDIFNREDGDIHTTTAIAVSGKREVTKEERKKAKAINFGFLYGMGATKFREYARDKYEQDLTMEEAIRFRQRFFDLYAELPRWHMKQRDIVKIYGQVRTLTGRIRHLPGVFSPSEELRASAERQAINTPVQSFASDLTVASIIEIYRTVPRDQCRIVGTVHDAILFEVRNEYIEEVTEQIKAIMEKPQTITEKFGIRLPVPIVSDLEVKPGGWGSVE